MTNSNRRRSGRKPGKPRPDFPLSIHRGSGYWCKKVRGKVHYFGKVADDPKGIAAEAEWNRVKDDLQAGREPRISPNSLTVADLAFRYLAFKQRLRDNGELAARTYQGYKATCLGITSFFGERRLVADLQPSDFARFREHLSEGRGLVSLRNEMQRIRSVLKFAYDEGLIEAPIRTGQSFRRPTLDRIRHERESHRQKYGDRMFEAHEIRMILAEATQPLKTMVLLAANGGLGQSDIANLPIKAVDLDSGWLDYARVKTAVQRRIPLWPETIKAIREWLPMRPKAKDKQDDDLMFLTVRGSRWIKINDKGSPKDAITQEFVKVIEDLGIRRPRLNFYGLRRCVETIGGESRDQVAVDAIMGHVQQGMGSHYRERISDARLRAVTDFVHDWLYPPETGDNEESPAEPETGPMEPSETDTGDSSDGPRLKLYVG